jgi:hypothetical protein
VKIDKSFTPIEVGEIDNFAFDFTRDVGDEDIVACQWSCRLAPFSQGADLNPEMRVPSGRLPPQYKLPYRADDGSLQYKSGFFAVAPVGPMPASAAGATYILGVVAFLSGGTRQIALNANVQCVLPGQ